MSLRSGRWSLRFAFRGHVDECIRLLRWFFDDVSWGVRRWVLGRLWGLWTWCWSRLGLWFWCRICRIERFQGRRLWLFDVDGFLRLTFDDTLVRGLHAYPADSCCWDFLARVLHVVLLRSLLLH